MINSPPLPDEIPCVVKPTRVEEVDESAYLEADVDVAKADQTARTRSSAVGQSEGPLQWANLDMVARMRVQKLARIRWRTQPPGFSDGEAPNFLSQETIDAFGIPEDVPVSAHPYGEPLVELIRANRDKLFLDVGAGLRYTYYANVVNVEIYRSVSTDVICVGETLPFADNQFDFVLCLAVLEHTMRPWEVAREMCRVLKPGGTIIVDWPFLQPVHGYPHHYFNATPGGNRSLLEAFCDITAVEIGWHHHPAIAAQWILTIWRNGLPPELATKFEAMTIGSLIKEHIDKQLSQDYCLKLAPELAKAIASGSVVRAVKRVGSFATSEADTLREELDQMRRSRSWRITAPMRALVGRLRSVLARIRLARAASVKIG